MTQNTTQSTADGSSSVPPLPPPKERRRLRESKSMTEKQVATAVGVSRATIRSWEAGRTTPRGRKAEIYAKLLAALGAELREKEAQTERAARRAAMERSAARQRNTSATSSASSSASSAASAPSAGSAASAPQVRRRAGPPQASPSAPASPGSRSPWPTVGPSLDPSRDRATAKAPVVPRTPARTPPPWATAAPAPAPAPASSYAPAPAPAGAGPAADTGTTDTTDTAADTPDNGPRTADQAFDALYATHAPALVCQAYLLTGRRALSQESVERAFRLAWQRWPEVAVDRDPAGWIRAAAHEYALSPWHRMHRRNRKRPRPVPGEGDPEGGLALREALLALPPSYRRALLLYDGLGLDLPDTAAEIEASTPATASRLTHAREAVAARVPEFAEIALLNETLSALTRAVTPSAVAPPRSVRTGCERRARFWTRTAIAFTALIVGATSFTLATAPSRYEPPLAPGEQIGDVPVPSGPERLSKEDRKLRDKLRGEPMNGPPRLVPEAF
ncbi:helix-turn-helix domain-containing protein [Streptomyces sp. GMY02]|uniref:transcriptional regulator n=1 Tax=Streptomyces sp. GMY02 TaxID=1333528 RepID=UPI001C2BF5DC|nr:transcriptional regulator [Streptomyces sp. GMY02]QXE35128.1 helix-turn-helix domain-containing protein [Streptomyces sp. GMY02]